MSPKLRNHSYRDVLKVLKKRGFLVVRQSGSHIILKHADGRTLPVPKYDVIAIGTLKSILQQAGISKEDFLKEL